MAFYQIPGSRSAPTSQSSNLAPKAGHTPTNRSILPLSAKLLPAAAALAYVTFFSGVRFHLSRRNSTARAPSTVSTRPRFQLNGERVVCIRDSSTRIDEFSPCKPFVAKVPNVSCLDGGCFLATGVTRSINKGHGHRHLASAPQSSAL